MKTLTKIALGIMAFSSTAGYTKQVTDDSSLKKVVQSFDLKDGGKYIQTTFYKDDIAQKKVGKTDANGNGIYEKIDTKELKTLGEIIILDENENPVAGYLQIVNTRTLELDQDEDGKIDLKIYNKALERSKNGPILVRLLKIDEDNDGNYEYEVKIHGDGYVSDRKDLEIKKFGSNGEALEPTDEDIEKILNYQRLTWFA